MGMARETRSIGPLTTRAAFKPASVNPATRTAEVVWSTGAKVLRNSYFDGPSYEELSMDPKHVRLDRLNNGAPFLADHYGSTDSVRGVVESARIENGQGIATVRFPTEGVSPEADKMFALVRDGIIQNVSVGYRTYKTEKVEGGDAKIPTFRAVDWQPYEISAVAMGADDQAGFRSSQPTTQNECVFETRGINMEKAEGSQQVEVEQRAIRAERERVKVLQIDCRGAKMSEEFTKKLIDDGVSVDAARGLILAEISKRTESIQIDSHSPSYEIGGQRGGHDDFRGAARDALLAQAGIRVARPHAAAADLAGFTVADLARTSLSRSGIPHSGLGAASLIKRAFTTSDFPNVLTDAIHASLRTGYENEPSTHRQWVRQEEVQDFRDQKRPILGSAPSLDPVAEGEEYTEGSMTDDSAFYAVKKFGKIVSLTLEMLVNDRLRAFLRVQPGLGQAARRAEADAVYAMFLENSSSGPTMQDSVNLFDAAHGNLVSGADVAITTAGLAKGRALLRKQQALGGGYLNVEPAILLVPPDLESAAEIVIAQGGRIQFPSGVATPTPEWVGKLKLVVEPRLASSAYYLIGSYNQIDSAVLGLLAAKIDGVNMISGPGPTIEENREFRKDEISYKVTHIFGTKFLDWRGIAKVPTT